MRPVNDDTSKTADEGAAVREPAQEGETSDEQPRSDLMPDRDRWTLEEEGYGYGV